MINCIIENGDKVLLRHVTVDALVVKDNKLLLIKRNPKAIEEAGKYGLPGGYLDLDEDPAQAAKRELKEETGYDSGKARLFRLIASPKRKGGDRQSINLAFIVEPLEKVSDPDSEVTEVVWLDLDNLPAQDLFAFDHYETIQLFRDYLKQKFPLPIQDF